MQGTAIGSMTGEDMAGQSVWTVHRHNQAADGLIADGLIADGLIADGLIFEIEQECSDLAMVFLLPDPDPPVFCADEKKSQKWLTNTIIVIIINIRIARNYHKQYNRESVR
ncbi:hypothetical protein [Enterocloster hominis (ex Hitch et al. 2024)]|uniref:Uncharacterized protein n=1 Tax=Enterocloster hominis (ex Hitch et al. 2024) TaxID=1917870 RepID=A0ABV1D8D3_9FIRM